MGIALFVKNCKIYETLEDMHLYEFRQFLSTKDNLWFCDYYKQKEAKRNVKKPHPNDLKNALHNIFGKIWEKTLDDSYLERFSDIHNLEKYKTKYRSVKILIETIKNTNTLFHDEFVKDFVFELEKWYKIDKNRLLSDQIEEIEQKLEAVKTEIDFYTQKLEKTDNKTESNLSKEIKEIELYLGVSYKIDEKTTTLAEWLDYLALAKEKRQILEKNANNKHKS